MPELCSLPLQVSQSVIEVLSVRHVANLPLMWHQNFVTDTPQRSKPTTVDDDEEEVSTQLNTSNCGAFLEV